MNVLLMKKVSIIAFISVLALVASNVFSYYNSFRWHKSAHESMLHKSIEVSSDMMEREINQVAAFTAYNLAKQVNGGGRLGQLVDNSEVLQTAYISEIRILRSGFMDALRKNEAGRFVQLPTRVFEGTLSPGWHFNDASGEVVFVKQVEGHFGDAQ
jgi:hypothetical protein